MDSPPRNTIERITEGRVWRSIFRHGWPRGPLERSLVMTSNLFLHLHPVKVSRRSLRFGYTMGLGVLAAILFGMLTITGVLLMFYYVPSVERAYPDIVGSRPACRWASSCGTCTAGAPT